MSGADAPGRQAADEDHVPDPHANAAAAVAWPTAGPLQEGRSRGEMIDEVRRVLRALPVGGRAVVAASGGRDSTALAFLTAEARPDLVLTLVHVRHGLRPDGDDLATVASHAAWLGIDHVVVDVHVAGPGGMEAAARAHRYAALRRAAAAAGAGWILLGHSAEDQAETVLLRIVRGTGVSGLAAMAPHRGGLVRPLLRLRRNDLARFVLHEGLPISHDPSNDDESIARVAVRSRLLPLLAGLGGDAVASIARLADLARADSAALDRLAQVVTDDALRRYGPSVAVRDDVLAQLEPALAARVLRAAVAAARPSDDPPTAAQVADLVGLSVGSSVSLPDVTATRGGGWVGLVPSDISPPPVRALAVPGITAWEHAGLEIEVASHDGVDRDGQLRLEVAGGWSPPELVADEAAVPPGGVPELTRVVVAGLPPGAVLRMRRNGDRVATTGGTRKLQDVLVDLGVPRATRDLLPVLAAGERVLWIPGVTVDAAIVAAGRIDPQAVLAARGRTRS